MCSHTSVDHGLKPGTYECQDCDALLEWRVDGEGNEYLDRVEDEDDACTFCGAPPPEQDKDWDWGCPDCGAVLKPVVRVEPYRGAADPDIAF